MSTSLKFTIVEISDAAVERWLANVEQLDESLIVELIGPHDDEFRSLFGRAPDEHDRALGLERVCDVQRGLMVHGYETRRRERERAR